MEEQDMDAAFDVEFADWEADLEASDQPDAAQAEEEDAAAAAWAPDEAPLEDPDLDEHLANGPASPSSGSSVDLDAEAEHEYAEFERTQWEDWEEDQHTAGPSADDTIGGPSPAKKRRIQSEGGQSADSAAKGSQPAASSGCPHPSYWAGLCVQCGAPKPDDPNTTTDYAALFNAAAAGAKARGGSQAAAAMQPSSNGSAGQLTRIKHLHARGHLEVGAGEAARLRQAEVTRLLNNKKLVLILDLDHTLVNSVRITEVDPEHRPVLDEILRREEPLGDKRTLYWFGDKNLCTKIRPGVFSLLESLKSHYDLQIYTNGDRWYAAEMRKILDPTKKLFSNVISACDSTVAGVKNLDVALADDRVVVILDDTEQVWPNRKANILVVDRYHFFPASRKQWGKPAGNTYLETGTDESEEEGMMAVCARVLKEVHNSFFSDDNVLPMHRRNITYCLTGKRSQILKGCVLVFSRCWPQKQKSPESHPLWVMAEKLGAECQADYDKHTTTHVVTVPPADTEKVVKARRHQKLIVTPDWLHACFFKWERVPESLYVPSATRPPKPQKPSAPGTEAAGSAGAGAGTAAEAAEDQLSPEERDKLELQRAMRSAGGGGA